MRIYRSDILWVPQNDNKVYMVHSICLEGKHQLPLWLTGLYSRPISIIWAYFCSRVAAVTHLEWYANFSFRSVSIVIWLMTSSGIFVDSSSVSKILACRLKIDSLWDDLSLTTIHKHRMHPPRIHKSDWCFKVFGFERESCPLLECGDAVEFVEPFRCYYWVCLQFSR